MVKSLNSPLYLCMDDIFATDGSTHPVPRPHPSNWKSRCWKSDRSRLGKGNFRVREWRARIKLAVKFLMISIHFEDSWNGGFAEFQIKGLFCSFFTSFTFLDKIFIENYVRASDNVTNIYIYSSWEIKRFNRIRNFIKKKKNLNLIPIERIEMYSNPFTNSFHKFVLMHLCKKMHVYFL